MKNVHDKELFSKKLTNFKLQKTLWVEEESAQDIFKNKVYSTGLYCKTDASSCQKKKSDLNIALKFRLKSHNNYKLSVIPTCKFKV